MMTCAEEMPFPKLRFDKIYHNALEPCTSLTPLGIETRVPCAGYFWLFTDDEGVYDQRIKGQGER